MSKQLLTIASDQFKPTSELILVKPDPLKTEDTTSTGLVLETRRESAVERPTIGRVVSVGPGVGNIEPGDVVLWATSKGLDLGFTDGDYLLLEKSSIIGFKL